jgi:serine/threonine-protein kinase HipA
MTTSNPDYLQQVARATGAFVWAWLPGAGTPVVCGRIEVIGRSELGSVLAFTYGRRYRASADAISLFTPELPLQAGTFDPTRPVGSGRDPLPLASCLRDSAPDAWGRRVINLRVGGGVDVDLSELTYVLASSSDRIGALDFQLSATDYVARGGAATLEQLAEMATLTDAGEAIPDDLAAAANQGTSIGGARPKALLRDGDIDVIAKFASSADDRPMVKAEALGMMLARRVGIDAPDVRVVRVADKTALLVDRFDRTLGGARRMLLSGLTVLGLGEYSARYGSYPMLADAIVASFANPRLALDQLYRRLVLNIAIGNNDDHLRNVAAFWDGQVLELAPAYDLTPSPRHTQVSSQAIAITRDGDRASQLWVARKAANAFRLTPARAEQIVDEIVEGVRTNFDEVADQVELTQAERSSLLGREILNPYIFYDTP